MFKDKDGNVITLDSFDAEQIKVLGLIFEGQLAGIRDGLSQEIAELVAAANETTTATLGELKTAIEGIKSPQNPNPNPKPEGELGQVLAKLEELSGTVTALKTERENDVKSRTVEASVDAYLEAKLPNLSDGQRGVMRSRLISMSPENEEAIKKGVALVRDEWKASGADVDKAFSADPKSEGGSEGTDPSDEGEKKAEKIKALQSRKPALAIAG